MKKTYNAPKVKTVNVRMSGIIASSPTANDDYGQKNGPRLSNERNDFFGENEEAAW